jgi:hypothetical protein
LGAGEEEDLYISEEERESHVHIIGTTGEGKSKLLERLICEDIDRGNGVCFLDPSDRGDTMYKILSYCSRIGHQKVLVIDPHQMYRFRRIAPIHPFKKRKEASVSSVMDTMRILFDMKDMAHFSFVQQYLPALVGVLHDTGMTCYESKYFTKYSNAFYRQS